MAKYFPLEALNPWKRPEGVAEDYKGALHRRTAWANHCFGVSAMVAELHARATGKPLLPLLTARRPPPPLPPPSEPGQSPGAVVRRKGGPKHAYKVCRVADLS